ncbi:glycosyltransferase 87 family protein [Streptomyces sp. HD]|uniref:glycosyltransferase 87 family protein n=1 Tax=Streptomyces sp. HD TaxID=3020892 RepID=UPI003FA7A3F0
MTAIVPSGIHRRVPVSLGVCLVSFTAFWAAQRAAHVSLIDPMAYRAEGATVRTGGDLYALRTTAARLPTTYPPFAALPFTPLTLLDTATMRILGTAGNLVLLVVFVRLSLRPVGHARVESVWWVAAPVLWDLSRRPGERWAGAGTAPAAPGCGTNCIRTAQSCRRQPSTGRRAACSW